VMRPPWASGSRLLRLRLAIATCGSSAGKLREQSPQPRQARARFGAAPVADDAARRRGVAASTAP
jgi:hypothetical protein